MVKELEVKVLNMDLNIVEEKIVKLGGKKLSEEFQINTLVDSYERPIKSYLDAYLRIRQTKDVLNNNESITLTLKKNIKNNDLRENIELNTEISDKDTMLQILKDLGFDKIEGARIDLDIWDEKTYPYPYMEIEVENKEALDNIIRILEIPLENISKKSIVELRAELE